MRRGRESSLKHHNLTSPKGMTVTSTIKWLLQTSRYLVRLKDDDKVDDRKANLVELLTVAAGVDGIETKEAPRSREEEAKKLDDLLKYDPQEDFQKPTASAEGGPSSALLDALDNVGSEEELPIGGGDAAFALAESEKEDGGRLGRLHDFLQGTVLEDNEENKQIKDAVTVATGHASKGLECGYRPGSSISSPPNLCSRIFQGRSSSSSLARTASIRLSSARTTIQSAKRFVCFSLP